MSASDWKTSAALNTSIAGINIAESMARSNVNDAMRAMMADLAGAEGTAIIGTAYGKKLSTFLGGMPNYFLDTPFTITTVKAIGDSFFLQPNAHTSGDSIAKKYAVGLGVSYTIQATSGMSTPDQQTYVYGNTVAASDHFVLERGQNDAQFVGSGDQRLKYDDIGAAMLADILFLGTPDGSRKARPSNVTAMPTAGTWAADVDLSGAYVSATNGSAKAVTFTDPVRYVVWFVKVKVGSTGQFQIKAGTSGSDVLTFSSAPSSGAIGSNTAQDWAVHPFIIDLERSVTGVYTQLLVSSATAAGNTVSVVGCVGLSGDRFAGPMIGVCDCSDRGTTGYATAVGSETALPRVSRLCMDALAVAQKMGIYGIDFPLSQYLPAGTALDTDQFHPSETGATNAAAFMRARVTAAQGFAGSRPDLAAQAGVQSANGRMFRPDNVLVRDESQRWVSRQIGGNSLYFQTSDNYVYGTVALIYARVDGSGVKQPTQAVSIIHDGTDGFVQALTGRARIKGALGNGLSIGQYEYSFPTCTVAALPAAATAGAGARAMVTDANATTFNSVVAAGGANVVPVFCDATNWRIG